MSLYRPWRRYVCSISRSISGSLSGMRLNEIYYQQAQRYEGSGLARLPLLFAALRNNPEKKLMANSKVVPVQRQFFIGLPITHVESI